MSETEKKFCPNCGSEVKKTAAFCPKCGEGLKGEKRPREIENKEPARPEPPEPHYNSRDFDVRVPNEYKPISMWGYFGYTLLFAIPCVGFILTLVFAFGGTPNINLRNFARSQFCFLILVVALILIIFLISAIAGAALYTSMY